MRGAAAALLLHLLGGAAAAAHRDVETATGAVRGYRSPRAPHHYSFLGVPYARPPTGHRRFKAPEPVARWDGLFEATHRVRCRQPDGGDHDCLVLNVFVPEGARALPVLVYVHGGGFQKGWGFHEVPIGLIRRDIIVVSINYRLGALGFLCLGTQNIPGNVGLKDQVAALKWVKRNIARFGGEASEVTVYGTGSGAASVELLVLSDVARNLFKRAILENGSALSPSTISHDSLTLAYNFAVAHGYAESNVRKNLEKFYYNLPTDKLTNISRIFVPCIEKSSSWGLVNRDPWDVMRTGTFSRVPMMMVYEMAEETTLIVEDVGLYKPPKDYEDLIPHNLDIDSMDHMNMILKFIKEFYFGDGDETSNSVESYINYVNDVFLQYPLIKSAVHHAYKSNVSIFLMNISDKSETAALSSDIRATQIHNVLKFFSKTNSYENDDLAETLTILWSNFIKLGDPTPLSTSKVPIIWQPVAPQTDNGAPLLQDIRCLKFSGYMINIELNCPQIMFWDRVYNQFYRADQE